jgi:hypothetical protein
MLVVPSLSMVGRPVARDWVKPHWDAMNPLLSQRRRPPHNFVQRHETIDFHTSYLIIHHWPLRSVRTPDTISLQKIEIALHHHGKTLPFVQNDMESIAPPRFP